MPIEETNKKAVDEDVIDFNEKYRDRRKEIFKHLLSDYSKKYGPKGNDKAVEFENDGKVFRLEADLKQEDLDSIVNSLADLDAINAKYSSLSRHLIDASRNSTLEQETKEGAQDFFEEIAKQAEHREMVGLSTQDFYGKLIQIGGKHKIDEKQVGKLWYDAKKNDATGRKAREQITSLIISDIQNQLSSNSLYSNTQHLTDAGYERLECYKLAVGQAARVLSHGKYAPNLKELNTLEEIRGELSEGVRSYLHNPEAPHVKDPSSDVYNFKKPKEFGKEKVKIKDLKKVAEGDHYKPNKAA